MSRKLFGLAASDVGRGVGVRPTLQHTVEHDGTRRLCEGREFAERVLGIRLLPLGVNTDEHDVLEPQLSVLDLGDVLQLGGQSRDAAQSRSLLAVPLIAVRGSPGGGGGILQGLRRTEDPDPSMRLGAREHAVDRVHRRRVRA